MRVIRAEQLSRGAPPLDDRLEEHCVYHARYEVAGVTMELCSDMPQVAEIFALRYADHPATRAPDLRYFVATVRGGYAFWSPSASAWRWSQGMLPADAVAFLADGVALGALLRYDAQLCSIDGCAVEYRGDGALLLAQSPARAGLLLACHRRGMRIYSDERVLLRGQSLQPLLRRCSVRTAGSRLLIAESSEPAKNELPVLPQLSLRTCFGRASIAQPHPLRAVFLLTGSGYCASLEQVDAAAVLPAVSRRFDARGDLVDRVARSVRILRDATCFRLTAGSYDETAAAIAYALGRLRR